MTGDAASVPLATELDAVLRASPLLLSLGGALDGWGPGWADVRLPTSPVQGNLTGTVHGGIVATAADAAFEAGCNSYGRVCVAVGLSLHYTAAAPLGVALVAQCREVSRTRRTASYRVDVTADGTLVAWAQALAYRTERWHLGAERWPDDWRARY